MSCVTGSFDNQVVDLIKQGGVGFLPTDTIYGLSCLALNQASVDKIHKLKDRAAHKPFIILISNTKMLDLLSIDSKDTMLVQKYWPGALSIILPDAKGPSWLTLNTATLAVRIPGNDQLRQLIDAVGPIVSTSANLQGQQPINSVAVAQKVFGKQLDFYVDFGKLDNPPSTLVAIKGGKLDVVRQGAVKID